MVEHAEVSGWDGAFVYDHFMPNTADGTVDDGPVLECWTTLSALAARTSRLRLGTLVLGMRYRHPAVLANMAATLDVLTGGRLVLGIGAGWQVNEHHAYGIGLPPPRQRLDEFVETCEVLRGLLTQSRTSFRGSYYQLDDAPCRPQPAQQPLPLLIGGTGEQRMLGIVARYADEWNAWTDVDTFRRKAAILDERCTALGRDPSTIARSTQAILHLAATTAELPPPAQHGRHRPLRGTPAEVQDILAAYRDLGLDEFIVPDDAAIPLPQRLDTLDLFHEQVAAPLRASG